MKLFYPISNDREFSVNFFRGKSTEYILDRLDEQNHLTYLLVFDSEREKYVNDYFAMQEVLRERNIND